MGSKLKGVFWDDDFYGTDGLSYEKTYYVFPSEKLHLAEVITHYMVDFCFHAPLT